jgi:hypothetical protein
MAQTKEGSRKAVKRILETYGTDFYKTIGAKGGKSARNINPDTGKAVKGFAISGKAREAGRIGGLKKRTPIDIE